jgi:hypothetical protein
MRLFPVPFELTVVVSDPCDRFLHVCSAYPSIGNSVKSHHYVVKPSSPSVLALFWVAAIPARLLLQTTPPLFAQHPLVQALSPLSLAAGRDLVYPRLELFQLGGKR